MRMAQPKRSRSSVADITPQALKTLVPQRFIAARQLSGLSQIDAAVKMGFQNSSMLSKIESGVGTALPYVLARAAVVYAVSSDFLMGLSNYPEKDPATVEQVAVMRAVRQTVTNEALKTMQAISKIAGDAVPLRAHLDALVKKTGLAYQEMCRMKSTAAPLRDSMEALVEAADTANAFLKRKAMVDGRAFFTDLDESLQIPLFTLMEKGGEVEQHETTVSAGASLREES